MNAMNAENTVKECCERAVAALYGADAVPELQVAKTRKEFQGDYTLVTFPLLKLSRKSPEETAREIGGGSGSIVPRPSVTSMSSRGF